MFRIMGMSIGDPDHTAKIGPRFNNKNNKITRKNEKCKIMYLK